MLCLRTCGVSGLLAGVAVERSGFSRLEALGVIMRPDILSTPEARGSEITHGLDSASTLIVIPRHTVVTPSVSGRF